MRRSALLALALACLLAGCAPDGEGGPPAASAPPSPVQPESSAPASPAQPESPAPASPAQPESPAPASPVQPESSAPPSPAQPESPAQSEAPEPADGDFVRAADYIPNLETSLAYATEDNFTGQVIYDFQEAWLRYGTVKKLAAAARELAEQGYGLLIWDAFRPARAQFRLWEVYPDPNFVADPNRGFSSHSRGNTVDLTLIGLDGAAVEMPSGFDEFSALADRDYSDVSQQAAAHALLLEEVLARHGFQGYRGEWWHYSDTDSYPVEEVFSPPGSGGDPEF